MSVLVDKVAQRLGVSRDRAGNLVAEFVQRIRAETAGGAEIRVSGLGVFRRSDGEMTFEPESRLATVVNHRFAGLAPVPVEAVTSGDRGEESEFAMPDIPIATIGSFASPTAGGHHAEPAASERPVRDEHEPGEDAGVSEEDTDAYSVDDTSAAYPSDPDDYSQQLTTGDDWDGGTVADVERDHSLEHRWSDDSGTLDSEAQPGEAQPGASQEPEPDSSADYSRLQDSDSFSDYSSTNFEADDPWFVDDDDDESNVGADSGDRLADETSKATADEWNVGDDLADTMSENVDSPAARSLSGDVDDPLSAARHDLDNELASDFDRGTGAIEDIGDVGTGLGVEIDDSAESGAGVADASGDGETVAEEVPASVEAPVIVKRKSRTLFYLSLIVVLLVAIAGTLYLLSLGDGDSSTSASSEVETQAGPETSVDEPVDEPVIAWTPGAIDRRAGGYTLVVSSQKTVDEANAIALELANSLRDEGMPIDVLRGTARGERWYRVAIGQFSRQSVAERELQRLADKLPEGAWVLRIRTNM